MRAKILLVVANFAIFGMTAAPAQAGLVNPTSTVDPFFDYVSVQPPTVGPQVAPSTGFSTGTPGPFSLAAPITPPMYTTEPFNLAADAGFFFTDTKVTIYNNADSLNGPGTPNPEHAPHGRGSRDSIL